MHTIGDMLAHADAQFAQNGGYRAIANCETRQVHLVERDNQGQEDIVGTTTLPDGVAPEDVASNLLMSIRGIKSDDIYFVTTLV